MRRDVKVVEHSIVVPREVGCRRPYIEPRKMYDLVIYLMRKISHVQIPVIYASAE